MVPPSRKPAHGNSAKLVSPASGRIYASIASGNAASASHSRTSGVVIATAAVARAKSAMRATRFDDRPHSSAAASIVTPITFRMSTFKKLTSGPQPSSCDCSRKRNASAKICSARRAAIDGRGGVAHGGGAGRRGQRQREAGEKQE